MTTTMSDRNEDEVDWSDGSIEDPPDASIPPSGDSIYSSLSALRDPLSASIPPSGDSGYVSSPSLRDGTYASTLSLGGSSDSSSSTRKGCDLDHFVEPQDRDEYAVPTGIPLSPGMCQLPTKVCQLTVDSCSYPFNNKNSASSNRRTPESSPAFKPRLPRFCIVSGQPKGLRGHIPPEFCQACSTPFPARTVRWRWCLY